MAAAEVSREVGSGASKSLLHLLVRKKVYNVLNDWRNIPFRHSAWIFCQSWQPFLTHFPCKVQICWDFGSSIHWMLVSENRIGRRSKDRRTHREPVGSPSLTTWPRRPVCVALCCISPNNSSVLLIVVHNVVRWTCSWSIFPLRIP